MQTIQPNDHIVRSRKQRAIRGDLVALVFLLPFTILYTVFTIFPVIQGAYMSFYKWTLMGKQDFVGFDNYTRMFGDTYFWQALLNTTKFVLYSTPLIMISSLGLALLANRITPLKRLYRTIYFLPNLLSVSVISFIAIYMAQPYNMGFLSNLMHSLGVSADFEIFWLKDTHLAWVTIVTATLWWTQGYNMMLYVSALQDIPETLYEAAAIDGATPRQQLFGITLPMLKKTTQLILMLQLISSFKVVGQIWLITKGGPGRATRPLIQYIYEQAFQKQKLGLACAMSFALFAILILLTQLQRRISTKVENE
ncbi:MAG: sugar ABC transporter permease [Clostridia bacterium]